MVSTYPSERRARNGAVTAATIPSTSSSQATVEARSSESQPQQIDRSHSGTTTHKEIGAVIEHTHDSSGTWDSVKAKVRIYVVLFFFTSGFSVVLLCAFFIIRVYSHNEIHGGAKSKYIMLQLGRRLSMGKPSSPRVPTHVSWSGRFGTYKYNLGLPPNRRVL